MADLFGWDLVYKLTEPTIKKKEDDIAILIHFLLVKSGFKCVGKGEKKELTDTEKESANETLPLDWNESNNYSIRYVNNGELYILRGVPINDSIVFNLLQVSSLAVANVAFIPNEVVGSLKGNLNKIFNDHEGMISQIRKELINPVLSRNNAEASTQTKKASSSSQPPPSQVPPSRPGPPDPESVPPFRSPLRVDPFWNDPLRDPLRDPHSIGRTDLDGFTSGGGMIFNPFEPRSGGVPDPGMGPPGNLPRGSVPPGARFDPFGPGVEPRRPPHNHRPPPDADHFLPPGAGGGMFM